MTTSLDTCLASLAALAVAELADKALEWENGTMCWDTAMMAEASPYLSHL